MSSRRESEDRCGAICGRSGEDSVDAHSSVIPKQSPHPNVSSTVEAKFRRW